MLDSRQLYSILDSINMRKFDSPVAIAVGGLFLIDDLSPPRIPANVANRSSLAVSDMFAFVPVKAPLIMLINMVFWGLSPSCPSGVIIIAAILRDNVY